MTIAAMTIGAITISGDVVVLGLITGMVYGVLAVGLVLAYRSTKVINFAHGQIGAFAAAVLAVAVLQLHVPYWIAFIGAMLIGAAIGGATDVIVIRRLRGAPVVISVIATLGLSQLLYEVSVVINQRATAGSQFPGPVGLPTFSVGALRVTPAYSAMLIVTPFVVAAVALFLRRGRLGVGVRAAAANEEAAITSGVVPRRMTALTWAIAGALAAYTAVLVLPSRGFTNAEFLGPGLLLRALVCAVIARMENLPVALVSGLGVGVVEQVLLASYANVGLVEAVLFVVIIVVLLVQRPREGRRSERNTWAAIVPWLPLPESYTRVFAIRNLARILFVVGLVIALTLPLVTSNDAAFSLVVIAALTLVGLSVTVVTGLGGQLSLGQFALAGVGATVFVVVTRHGFNYAVGIILGALAAAAVSLVLGLPALRIRGFMLAVTSLAFALAAQDWLFTQSWMLGSGIQTRSPVIGHTVLDTGKRYYFLALLVLVCGLWLARNVWRGAFGRRLRAVRDNDDAARAFSVQATTVRLQGFVVAGFLAGLGGAVYGGSLSLLTGAAFPIDSSISAAATAVVGGLGVLIGPLLGALYIIGVPRFVPLDSAELAATSLGWLLLILEFPGGIAQAVGRGRDWIADHLARRAGLDPFVERADLGPVPVGVTANLSSLRPTRTASTPSTALEARSLTRRFGGVSAVSDVSLSVQRGETLGLIGPNGAGKTTLFELLSGFTAADDGAVLLDGKDITRLSPERRAGRGLVRSFQDAGLFPTLTVLEAVSVSLERVDPSHFVSSLTGFVKPERRKLQRSYELVATMGLYRYRNTQVRALSTGTRHIAELTCLLAMQPDVLLLDEPSSGIAQREAEALGELLRSIKEQLGVTLVIIEHDIPLIMSLSDRIVAMEAGKVIADGPPEVVRHDPRVVESYLGGDLQAIERSGPAAPSTVKPTRRRSARSPAAATAARGAGARKGSE